MFEKSTFHMPLIVPQVYRVLRHTFFDMPWTYSPKVVDILVNVIGFIPFDLFFFSTNLTRTKAPRGEGPRSQNILASAPGGRSQTLQCHPGAFAPCRLGVFTAKR